MFTCQLYDGAGFLGIFHNSCYFKQTGFIIH